MVAVAKSSRTTPEEYLYWERRAANRHEYLNGCILAMAGASWEHGVITGNAQGELHSQLKGTPCVAVPQDLRVRVPECNRYYYPDVVVVCDEPKFEDAELDTLLNPTLIFEVLSHSTERRDRGEKFDCYTLLPSLQVYVLIAQHEPRLECFTRQPEGWSYTVARGLEGTLLLKPLGVTLRLADLYARVTFPPPEENSSPAPTPD